MQAFLIPEAACPHLNLYSAGDSGDDFELIALCKAARERGFGSLTVAAENVESAWKWLELSGVALVGRLDMMSARCGAGGAFRRIKGIFSAGAAAAEVALPVDFLDPGSRAVPPDARECLDAVAEAGAGRPLKFSIETGFIGSPSAIARMVGLLSGCGAGCVKTASGLYPKMSSISDLNAALSALDAMGEGGAGLDFLFDPKLANRFVIDDAFRLAGKVCGAEFAWDGRFSVSVPFEIL